MAALIEKLKGMNYVMDDAIYVGIMLGYVEVLYLDPVLSVI